MKIGYEAFFLNFSDEYRQSCPTERMKYECVIVLRFGKVFLWIIIMPSFQKGIRMLFVSQLHSTLSVNEAVISDFKAAADHYRRPLCDRRPLLIQSQAAPCLCLSVSVLPSFIIKAQDTKQSVHFAVLIFSQRTTACLLLEITPDMQQLSPLTSCNCPLLIKSKNMHIPRNSRAEATDATEATNCIYRWWQPAWTTWLHLRMACSWQTLSKVISLLYGPFPTGGGRGEGSEWKKHGSVRQIHHLLSHITIDLLRLVYTCVLTTEPRRITIV